MPNRLVCSVLEEMRSCAKTGNYSYLPGLIEEAQTMVNRMEAALYDIGDFNRFSEELSKLRKEVKKLRAEKKQLGGKTDE
jgi:hypothetical protein